MNPIYENCRCPAKGMSLFERMQLQLMIQLKGLICRSEVPKSMTIIAYTVPPVNKTTS